MNIDEAIEDMKECDSYQVAEWLEELKFLRTTKETMFREIYNQALEDAEKRYREWSKSEYGKVVADDVLPIRVLRSLTK